MSQNNPKYDLAWKIYKYVRYKPELVKNEKIANLFLRATKYLYSQLRYKSLQEKITHLNTNADKENTVRPEPINLDDFLNFEF